MNSSRTVRYQGRITTWKDEQGFGFITPNGGGPPVFVHIRSFADRGIRPVGDEIVTYHLAANDKGQARAENVTFVRGRKPAAAPSPARPGSPVIALGFIAALGAGVLAGRLPVLVLGLYLVLGVATFIAYALDKSAARNDRWRIREDTLHLLALAGGWPGALLAQRYLRHKSSKQSFQRAFWITVVVNCAGLAWLLSPYGATLRTLA